ncbi:hypothetical protein ACYJW8_06545 [Frateuria aurantia]
MRELSVAQTHAVAGGQIQSLATPISHEVSTRGFEAGGSVISGAGGTSWSASAGYSLPGGVTIGGHIGGFGGSVTGGGIVISVAF